MQSHARFADTLRLLSRGMAAVLEREWSLVRAMIAMFLQR